MEHVDRVAALVGPSGAGASLGALREDPQAVSLLTRDLTPSEDLRRKSCAKWCRIGYRGTVCLGGHVRNCRGLVR
jgi:hypothetical protein